jgi:hypothetical protein
MAQRHFTTLFTALVVAAFATATHAEDVQQAGFARVADGRVIPQPDPVSMNGNYGYSGYAYGHSAAGCETCKKHSGWFDGKGHWPGQGWCYPTKVPLQYGGIGYTRYYPKVWPGQHGAVNAVRAGHYPSVGLPTDTTQLGYYYHHTPQWTPQPGRIPGLPYPPRWHRTVCDPSMRGPMIETIEVQPGEPAAPSEGEVPPAPPADGNTSASYFPES